MDLRKEFKHIREAFFPRWDRKGEWRVKQVWNLPSSGKYDDTSKGILIRDISDDQNELHKLLIHTICHFVSYVHGSQWKARMLKAARRAEELGRKELSRMLLKEVEAYRRILPESIIYKEVYRRMEDVVWETPAISYWNLIRYIAKEFGLYPNEVRAKFRRSEKVYLMVKEEIRREKKVRKKWL